jgi:hypothetical protein
MNYNIKDIKDVTLAELVESMQKVKALESRIIRSNREILFLLFNKTMNPLYDNIVYPKELMLELEIIYHSDGNLRLQLPSKFKTYTLESFEENIVKPLLATIE